MEDTAAMFSVCSQVRMKSFCFSPEFDLLDYDVFLGADPAEKKPLYTLSIVYNKGLSKENTPLYHRTLEALFGQKNGKKWYTASFHFSSFSHKEYLGHIQRSFYGHYN